MRFILSGILIAVFASIASAQTPTIAERRACHEQARRFVNDSNKDLAAGTGGHVYY